VPEHPLRTGWPFGWAA